jgi:4-hydroxy-2-oxoheptanedioate aldolase
MTAFKTKLRTGLPLLGTFLQIPAAEVAEIVGRAGFDCGIVDTEHGMLGTEDALSLVRACDAVGMATVFRVPGVDHHRITQALDFGASAVMVPNIQSRKEAELAISAAKYHPHGNRGVCPFARGAAYDSAGDPEYYRRSNAETAVVLQIEGTDGIAHLDEILSVANIDCIFIGPFDLAQSLGIPGQVTSPLVVEAMRDIVKRAKQKGIAVGSFSVTPEQAQRDIEIGIQFLAYGTDTMIMARQFRAIRESILTSPVHTSKAPKP